MLISSRRVVRRKVAARYRRYGLALILVAPLLVLPAMGRAQEGNRAGVIVVKGDGEVLTACVAFSEPTISGLGLLERSGLDFTIQASGGNATVCSIAGEGCGFPAEGCFCQCQGGGPCRYWSYWYQNGGVWQYSTTGAPLRRVPPGGVDGWIWGEGASGAAPRPPSITFDAICPAPVADPPPPVEPAPTLAPVPAEPTSTLAPPPPEPTVTLPPPTTVPPTATRPQPSATRPAPTTAPPSPTQRPIALPPSATVTLVPPTQLRIATPTAAPPAGAAESQAPSTTELQPPSTTPVAPTATPVAATSTPTMSPSLEPTPSSLPSQTSTLAPSPTSAPAASATSTASIPSEPPSTPTLVPPTATPAATADQPSGTGAYVLFGGTLAFLLTGLVFAWRRRR